MIALTVSLALVAGQLAGGPNLVIITVDGVRWSEVFQGVDAGLARHLPDPPGPGPTLPRLWRRLRSQGGFLTGDAARGDPFRTRNLPVCSLPGYQSIFAGRDLGCLDNDCPQVEEETFLERVRRELGLARREVAVFASWPPIGRAVARDPSALAIDVGPAGEAEALAPWGYRLDRATWALAMDYLERERPRLLYVGLGDADEWGHRGDYPAYLASIRALDQRLEELEGRLARLGGWGARTSVVVTTDHGRGEGAAWTAHGPWQRGADQGFLYARTPGLRAARVRSLDGPYDHLHVRPTVEALFGLIPCAHCQRPILELLQAGPLAHRAWSGLDHGSGAGAP